MSSRELIHAKIIELAKGLGREASDLRFDQEIPASGYLDSAAIMELILWLETQYDFLIAQEDLTLANLGTVDAIAEFVRRTGANPE